MRARERGGGAVVMEARFESRSVIHCQALLRRDAVGAWGVGGSLAMGWVAEGGGLRDVSAAAKGSASGQPGGSGCGKWLGVPNDGIGRVRRSRSRSEQGAAGRQTPGRQGMLLHDPGSKSGIVGGRFPSRVPNEVRPLLGGFVDAMALGPIHRRDRAGLQLRG